MARAHARILHSQEGLFHCRKPRGKLPVIDRGRLRYANRPATGWLLGSVLFGVQVPPGVTPDNDACSNRGEVGNEQGEYPGESKCEDEHGFQRAG